MHRVSNRLGWVKTNSPEQTEKALARVLPREYWLVVNRLMLLHGRATCLPGVPQCRRCPVREWCMTGQASLSSDDL